MKRKNNLLNDIADMENLRLAFWKAQRGKQGNQQVLVFQNALEDNLRKLRHQIISIQPDIGHYHYFKVFDPKERQICAAAFSERVLHHAIMNICHQSFENYQIGDSYASRIGKGTYAALERAAYFQKKYSWYLKLDVRKYFDNINHSLLLEQLQRRFKEWKLLKIFDDIIKSYEVSENKGLPIGNLTSQYFANHFLAISDHFIKENLKCPAYVRYMDDMVLWHDSKESLLNIGKQLNQFMEMRLALQLKPFCLNSTEKALPFLGYLVSNNNILLNKNSRKRFVKKLKSFEFHLGEDDWSQEKYQSHVLPLIAFTRHANSFGFRKKVLEKLGVAANRE